MHSIYLITNTAANQHYVGYTSYSLNNRIGRHLSDSKRGSTYAIHLAIRIYGWENFTAQIIYQSPDYEHTLQVMEPHFIKEYDSYYNGYNGTLGGGNTGPETSAKISATKKGMEMPWMIGHKHNEGFFWINNGTTSKRCYDDVPEGWNIGRHFVTHGPRLNGTKRPKFENGYKKSTKPRKPMSDEHRAKIAASMIGTARAAGNKNVVGRIWVNNGIKNQRVLPDNIPEGFKKGRLNNTPTSGRLIKCL